MPDILYHYCSTEAFRSIISSASIRLSSLTQSSDSKEGQEISGVFERIRRGTESKTETSIFLGAVEGQTHNYDAYGFCLSEKRDLLSQWRGYADDANGFCIGFKTDTLLKLDIPKGFILGSVAYDFEQQANPVRKLFSSFLEQYPQITAGSLSDQQRNKQELNLQMQLKVLSLRFLLKNPAFKEEAEWRLYGIQNRSLYQDTEYFSRGNMLVPFRSISLIEDREGARLIAPVISEVILGPKNKTPDDVIYGFLGNAGFDLPRGSVKKSLASYN